MFRNSGISVPTANQRAIGPALYLGQLCAQVRHRCEYILKLRNPHLNQVTKFEVQEPYMADDRNESQQSGGEQGTENPSKEKQQNPFDEQESTGNEQKRRAPGSGEEYQGEPEKRRAPGEEQDNESDEDRKIA
jgi:hypothetical protein